MTCKWTEEKRDRNDHSTINYKMAIDQSTFLNLRVIQNWCELDDYHITIFDELPFRKKIQASEYKISLDNLIYDYNTQHNYDYYDYFDCGADFEAEKLQTIAGQFIGYSQETSYLGLREIVYYFQVDERTVYYVTISSGKSSTFWNELVQRLSEFTSDILRLDFQAIYSLVVGQGGLHYVVSDKKYIPSRYAEDGVKFEDLWE
ncbi:hypothetical protein RyT2_02380 [Pseudolactococcus yaeyamensis]